MSGEERRKRNESAREVVRTNDIARWITRQVQDIRDLVSTPGLRAEQKKTAVARTMPPRCCELLRARLDPFSPAVLRNHHAARERDRHQPH